MRKALLILLSISLVILGGCKGGQIAPRPTIAYVNAILTDPHSHESLVLSSCADKKINADIATIDTPERCLLLSEAFMESDSFDNVDGSAAVDGLPDFAGERIASLMDDRYVPYQSYLDGREDELREIAVRSFISALDTVCCLAAFDKEGRSQKPSSKAVVLSSSLMAAYGRFDIDTLVASTGADIQIFSPVNSMISELLDESASPVNAIVLASSDVIRSGAYQTVFSEMTAAKGDTLSKCILFAEPDYVVDSMGVEQPHADLLRSLLDSCRASGLSHVNALMVDDYSVSVAALEELLSSVLSSTDEADVIRRQVLARNFKISDPRKSVVSDCYRTFRNKNLFTHNIAYPIASAYITSPESSQFMLMDFDESSLPDGTHELMMDMAPKTHKSYVQNQHFAGGN